MNDYEDLLKHCNTERQKEIFLHLATHLNKKKTQKELLINKDNLNRMIRLVKKIRSSREINSPNSAKTILPLGFSAKGLSNYYNKDGELSGQWIKMGRDAEEQVDAVEQAVESIIARLEGKAKTSLPIQANEADTLMNLIISNDLHLGLYASKKETMDRDYSLDIAYSLLSNAIDSLVSRLPKAKYCIVADLGDMTEGDNFKNATPNSGHPLDIDGRHGDALELAIQSMIMMIDKALLTHELVYFYNISGNHDIVSAMATRKAVNAWYRNDDRVIACNKNTPQKYHKHGKTLLGFAHGDGLKMHDAGEIMVMQAKQWYSETEYHEYHFGHNHKDKIVDGRLCKAESHRNLPPLNAWASHAGFGRELGSMKAITYCSENGRVGTTEFNVGMVK